MMSQGKLMRSIRSAAGQGLLLLATSAVGVDAIASEKTTKLDQRPSQIAQSPQPPERNIAFEMRDKPWIGERGSVLEWLSDQTGMPVSISSAKPTGSLTFVNPRIQGAPKQYSLPEVIDVLNGELLKQKLILVRRAKTFSIEPADEKIDPAVLPRVTPSQLEHYGDTELVSAVFSLTALVAEDIAGEIKGMLGPFGTVVSLAHANKLVVQDTVANLKRIRAIVRDSEDTERAQSASFSHTCRYIQARQAERILRDLLGDPRELLRAMQPRGGVDGPFAQALGTSPVVANAPKVRMHYLSVDEGSNTVLVTGPADKIAQAEAIMRKIDAPQYKGQKPVPVGPPTLKTYEVSGGNAEVLAKNLQEIYKNVPGIRIAAVTSHSIMVWAGPSDQSEIVTHLRSSREQSSAPEVIPLTSLDASDAVETLKGMFGGDGKSGAPYVKADTTRNAVIAKGTPEQLSEIRIVLKTLGEGSASRPDGNIRILTIEQGSALSVAETLERMLPQFLPNPIEIIAPGGERRKELERPKSD